MAADEEVRLCKLGECGKGLVRKTGETAANFKSREFCDKTCSGIWTNLQRRVKRQR